MSVYLYGPAGKRRHIAAHPSVQVRPPALCGRRFYTEEHYLKCFVVPGARDAQSLRALPVCAHCGRAKAGWQ